MERMVSGKIRAIGTRTVDVVVDGSGAIYKNCVLPSSISTETIKVGQKCTFALGRSGNTVLSIEGPATERELNVFNENQLNTVTNLIDATYYNTYTILNGAVITDQGFSGRRFFTHSARALISILPEDTEIFMTHGPFVVGELLYAELANETFEYILVEEGPYAEANPAGGTYYRYVVERGVWDTQPKGFSSYTMIYGLTRTAYIHTLARETGTTPMISMKIWEDIDSLTAIETLRIGNLTGILGDETERFGMFVGTENSHFLYDSVTGYHRIRGANIEILDASGHKAFSTYAYADGGFDMGDIVFGDPELVNMLWSPTAGSLTIRLADDPYITFDPVNGSVINQTLTVGENGRPMIQIGMINDLVSFFMRDQDTVPIVSMVEDVESNSVEVVLGRPMPNYGWMRYKNGSLDMNGEVHMTSGSIDGMVIFGENGGLTWGDGPSYIDKHGIRIDVSSFASNGMGNSYSFVNASNQIIGAMAGRSDIVTIYSDGYHESEHGQLSLESYGGTSKNGYIFLLANADGNPFRTASLNISSTLTDSILSASGRLTIAVPAFMSGADALSISGGPLNMNGNVISDVDTAVASDDALPLGQAVALFGTTGAIITRASTQAIAATTTTAIQFTTEVADTEGYANLGTNNTRLTAPRDGWYTINGYIDCDTAATTRYATLRISGSTVIYQTSATMADARMGLSGTYYLTAGQYIEATIYNVVAANIDAAMLVIAKIG